MAKNLNSFQVPNNQRIGLRMLFLSPKSHIVHQSVLVNLTLVADEHVDEFSQIGDVNPVITIYIRIIGGKRGTQ